jgi:hypothetical protein
MLPTEFQFIWLRLISSQFVNKHGHHRQFLFLIGRIFKIFSTETAWPNEPTLGKSSIKIAGEDFFRNNQKQELAMFAMFVNG